ncbi:hypothetical protein Vretimale_14538 [Volvox reticuliferus]|uniref:FAD dependent oxidoreductase domain-containing protein n=1 Tax=Volvox reticuliferus TaxID=1737510 RepID=A0A8J4GPS9_9CHLO|nr:hypothetical protein Vretifemale_13268 [Volvox reticuliferus]GIM10963.1 hypothetical protein Vretimale_14538 [Volvox reticuliferus]
MMRVPSQLALVNHKNRMMMAGSLACTMAPFAWPGICKAATARHNPPASTFKLGKILQYPNLIRCNRSPASASAPLQLWRAVTTLTMRAGAANSPSETYCNMAEDGVSARIDHATSRVATSATRRQITCVTERAHYDVVVVGLGAFGSSVLYHLAKAGLKVLGVERYGPVGHSFGSSHGASRIIRMAYFEGLQYGPLLKRSMRLFLELQDELAAVQGPLSEPLFLRTGMLDVGSVLERALCSAQVHGLEHEVLTGAELNRRFPAYRVPEHWRALYQPDGGVLTPERIVQAYVGLAQRMGAQVLTGTTVAAWRTEGAAADAPVVFELVPTDVSSATASNFQSYTDVTATATATAVPRKVTAAAAVLAPGPWIGQLVPEIRELCVPERQVVGWFEIEAAARRDFAPERFPIFVLEETPGGAAYYGFPEHGQLPGFKIGRYRHLYEQIRDPGSLDRVNRTANATDEAALRAGVSSYFPTAAGRLLTASTCFFTNTPDGHFLVDRHPRHPQVILCSACSGHGFKMSSGIGQLISRMVMESPKEATAAGSDSGEGDWSELLPFRFSPGDRPGHREALDRFS